MPTTQLNKSALNALVDLYYLYNDMVRNASRADESPDELDRFFLRSGLKDAITECYSQAGFDPAEADTEDEPLTLERLLPRRAISDVVGEYAVQVSLNTGDLKYLSDKEGAYEAPIPEAVQEVIRTGRQILAGRYKRSRSVSDTAATDLASAMVAYEEHILKIGPKTIPIRSWTLEDLVLEYMFNHCTRDEWVDRDRIVNWVIDTLNDESKKSKAIYDKCVAINNKIKAQLETSLELFDTSRDGYIKRNY
jgi:hypothetical protein